MVLCSCFVFVCVLRQVFFLISLVLLSIGWDVVEMHSALLPWCVVSVAQWLL